MALDAEQPAVARVGWLRCLWVALLLLSLVMPSDWTQDVPARYGKRHAGLTYTALYPRIDTAPPPAPPRTPQ